MPRDPDRYDFFVSYARKDNGEGWISGLVNELLGVTNRRRWNSCGKLLSGPRKRI
jgi:hypothetical protein